MSFDTTSSNTGPEKGACVLIEATLGRLLLWLACRHHIMELLLRAAWDCVFGASSAPSVPLFNRFKTAWFGRRGLEGISFSLDMVDPEIHAELAADRERVVTFIKRHLEEVQPRDDYLKLLELGLLFLEERDQLPASFTFKAPGAVSHARWMSKAIYCLKIWLFRAHFKLSKRETQIIPLFCSFVLQVYIEAWFQSPLAISAPRLDLELLQKLLFLSKRSSLPKKSNVFQAAAEKLGNHLWYLSDEQVALAFFDPAVTLEEKRRMVVSIRGRKTGRRVTRLTVRDPFLLESCQLSDFVSTNSREFFKITNISEEFLNADPEMWDTMEDYTCAQEQVRKLKVVNDTAERGVALIKAFNKSLTRNEEQLQYLLKVVQQHREAFPDCRKSTILGSLSEEKL